MNDSHALNQLKRPLLYIYAACVLVAGLFFIFSVTGAHDTQAAYENNLRSYFLSQPKSENDKRARTVLSRSDLDDGHRSKKQYIRGEKMARARAQSLAPKHVLGEPVSTGINGRRAGSIGQENAVLFWSGLYRHPPLCVVFERVVGATMGMGAGQSAVARAHSPPIRYSDSHSSTLAAVMVP